MTNPKIIILGDTHFGVKKNSPYFFEVQRRFFHDDLFPYMKENGITTIIQTGDLFDSRTVISMANLNLVKKEIFDYMADENIRFFTLAGNHDIFLRDSTEVYTTELVLAEYDNVYTTKEFATINIYGLDIDLIPWICKDNTDRIAESIKMSQSRLAVGHFELMGFQMYKGQHIDYSSSARFLSGYEKVLSGHFHTHSEQDNIKYLGTPYELTFADWNDPKGFYVLDTNTLALERIINPTTVFEKIVYPLKDAMSIDLSDYKDKIVRLSINSRDDLTEQFIHRLIKIKPEDLRISECSDVVLENIDIDIEQETTLSVLIRTVKESNFKNESEIIKILTELHTEIQYDQV